MYIVMLNVSALWHICFRPDPYHIFAVSFDSFICMEVHSSGIEKQVGFLIALRIPGNKETNTLMMNDDNYFHFM